MKLTNEQLKQIIKEELEAVLNEEEQIEEVYGRPEMKKASDDRTEKMSEKDLQDDIKEVEDQIKKAKEKGNNKKAERLQKTLEELKKDLKNKKGNLK